MSGSECPDTKISACATTLTRTRGAEPLDHGPCARVPTLGEMQGADGGWSGSIAKGAPVRFPLGYSPVNMLPGKRRQLLEPRLHIV